ncbi:phytanoyl-CoA dioxygenase family protein [Sphaerospermopsis torques-reginae]|uniref:Phytanoyl-CoA dioxygenase family protein n=1 Tax=Sphaerospermopsis torques-reginae ITEP-024 TaxID=984208 RepID=A0ABX8WVW1_9CYAN|nr:phytanoyl-CoA dioxygenase family protein [Sphaerospermopsis torques-reginae]QYX30559.1 phytanoyl-CoA dioxygenase family protein [Sphaerospermopsis torques-reginae ITEP-024]
MKLTREQVQEYENQGFLFIPQYFSQAVVSALRANIPELIADEAVGRVWEADNKTLRTLYGVHLTNKVFNALVRHPLLLEPAQQLFASELYVFRSKIVMKPAFTGGMWEWHQDSAFAQYYEEIPSPKGGNVIIFLDEVNEFNGPVYYINGSHQQGLIALEQEVSTTPSLTKDYLLNKAKERISSLVDQGGIVAPKGPAGSVLFVHYDTWHGSVGNISPFDRRNLVLTYSSVEETALPHKERPAFLSDPDRTPLTVLSTEAVDSLFAG